MTTASSLNRKGLSFYGRLFFRTFGRMLSEDHIKTLETISKNDDDAVAAIKLLAELTKQRRIDELREELFGI